MIDRFSPEDSAPCISLYSLIELRRRPELWEKFVDFFKIYPWFLTKTYTVMIADEIEWYSKNERPSPLLNAFSPLSRGVEKQVDKTLTAVFGHPTIESIEAGWRQSENDTLATWLSNRDNFSAKRPVPNALDAKRYVSEAWIHFLAAEAPSLVEAEVKAHGSVDLRRFPALAAMLYSQYYRLYDKTWKARPGEVTDVMISAVVPYMDAFISEAFQVEIFRKTRHSIAGLADVEFLRASKVKPRLG